MPTFGWVQESAWNRILSAFEATPEPGPPRSQAIACPFCGASFTNSSELQDHLGGSHHVARPVLLINGREPNDGFVLRRAPRASDIDFVSTTSVSLALDNEPTRELAQNDVWQVLAKTKVARVRILVENAPVRKLRPANWQSVTWSAGVTGDFRNSGDVDPEPVRSSYDIQVMVASSAELNAVERAFETHLNVPNLTRDSVSAFLADPRCKGAAEDYGSGMAEYALGVLVKEGRHDPGLESPLARYREHFGSALIKFEPHGRPLPRLLSAFMRFSLNDFSHAGENTGHFGLDRATKTLADPAGGLRSFIQPEASAMRHICPIDHGTDRVLRLAEEVFSAKRWSAVLADECRQVASAGTLDLTDQDKAAALWALAALHLGATRDAIEPLQRIHGTYPFDKWAYPTLDAVTA